MKKHETDCGCWSCLQRWKALAEKLQRDLDEMSDWNFRRDSAGRAGGSGVEGKSMRTQRKRAFVSVEFQIRRSVGDAEHCLRVNSGGYGRAYRRERLRLWRLALAAVEKAK